MEKGRKLTNKDFQTREGAVKVLMEILDPLKPFYSKEGARLDIGYTATHYENDTIPMEAFARVLWGLVPFWAGGSSAPDFEEIYIKGLTSGTNPHSSEYWHTCRDYDQKFCEMSAIAFGMLFAPEKVWEPLSEQAKDNLIEWLWEINRKKCCACNWQFFSIITNVAMHKVGRAYDKEHLQEGLDMIETFYEGGGWYHDGNVGDKDYYNAFVMATFSMVYSIFMETEDPERCRRYRERALSFGKDYVYWFSEEGASFPYGRSMTYRFAQVSYFAVCALCGVEVFTLAELKGIIVRNLVYWLNYPIFDNAGVLTIGYGYPNLQMSESYNAPGSPYWALSAFLFLALPKEHPFWDAEIAPMPKLERKKYLQHANMLIQRGNGNVVALVPGSLKADGHSHGIEKYSKFAYSSKFGFSVARTQAALSEAAPDSMLAIEVYGQIFVKKEISPDYSIDEDGMTYTWTAIDGIEIKTHIEATSDGHIRTHEIKSNVDCVAYDCGFALSTGDKNFSEAKANGNTSSVTNEDGYCMVEGLVDGGEGRLLKPEPNTNLIAAKTTIPMVVYHISKGTSLIRTHVAYFR